MGEALIRRRRLEDYEGAFLETSGPGCISWATGVAIRRRRTSRSSLAKRPTIQRISRAMSLGTFGPGCMPWAAAVDGWKAPSALGIEESEDLDTGGPICDFERQHYSKVLWHLDTVHALFYIFCKILWSQKFYCIMKKLRISKSRSRKYDQEC